MDRAREDEWPVQLPTLPNPPVPTSQHTDTSILGRQKQQRSNTPVYPHPQSGNSNQLPPIRNLVPNLWEPGTSRSSQQISDEGQNGSSVYRLHPIGPAWSGGSMNASDKPTPRPQPGTNHHKNESNRDVSSQVNGPNKRTPSSPVERADHVRTAPPNSINSDRGNIRHPHKSSQMSKQTREKPDVRPHSNSEATKPTTECPGSAPQPSHQQELLRDPVSKKLLSRVTRRCLTHLFWPRSILAFRITATFDTPSHDHQRVAARTQLRRKQKGSSERQLTHSYSFPAGSFPTDLRTGQSSTIYLFLYLTSIM